MIIYPQSQAELIRAARGRLSQAAFSRALACDRSCLSRYENGSLGAPPHVITRCLQIVAAELAMADHSINPFERALSYARQAVEELEFLEQTVVQREERT